MRKFENPKINAEGPSQNRERRPIELPPAFNNAPEVLKRWVRDALEENPHLTVEELGELVIMLWLESGSGIEMTPDVRKAVRTWIASRIVASK